MRLPKDKWPDTDGSRGILMFAQLMGEMLNPTTFESFRVYSLDTIARLHEALELVDDVRDQRVPRAVLDPIIDEMKWSFKKDPAAKTLATAEIESLLTLLATSFSLEDFYAHLVLIERLVSERYKSTIERLILELYDQPDQRMDYRKLVGFYCSHLINIGYERNHIRSIVESSFFAKPVVRMGRKTLEKFLKTFDGRNRRYLVHVGVTRDLGIYLRRLGYSVVPLLAGSPYEHTIGQNSNAESLRLMLEWPVETLDPVGAMDSAYQFLSGQRAIAFLDPYGMQCEWGSTMHVTLHRAQSGQAVTKTDFLQNRPRPLVARPIIGRLTRAQTISNYAADIAENFDEQSKERLLSSIRTAALARTSFNSENRLISLWSAIEVLLSEPRSEARIVHYAKLIVPCIVMFHARRQIISVYNDLMTRYRSRVNNIFKSMPTESRGQSAFAELLFLPENAIYQKQLCDILGDNPLALHRVFKIHRDYKNIKSTNSTMDDHYDRVLWQIHRVYRARNQLVHAGRMPTYLESVILNLAEYYRSAVVTIVGHAKKQNEESDIDQIVSEIVIKYGIIRSQFRRCKPDDAMTKDQIRAIMDKNQAS